MTAKQLKRLEEHTGLTMSEIVSTAIDRMYTEEIKMLEKIEITIGEDEESFLGNDPAAIAQVDIEASKENFEKALRKEIRRRYPDLVVNFAWGGNSDYAWLMDRANDREEYKYLQDDLEEIGDRIYNQQDFWVTK